MDCKITWAGEGVSFVAETGSKHKLVMDGAAEAGGKNLGLRHGQYWRNGETRMSNIYLSILHKLGIETNTFADSTGTSGDAIFG